MRIYATICFFSCLLFYLSLVRSQPAEPELKSPLGDALFDVDSRDPVADEAEVEIDCKEETVNPANPWFRASLHKLPLYQNHFESGVRPGGGVRERCLEKRTPAQIFSSGIPLGKSHSVDESIVDDESKGTKVRREINPVKRQDTVRETAVEERPLTFYQPADVVSFN